jgi:uncharacterized protein (TIGR00295 family)
VGCSPDVIEHCKAVAEIAIEIAKLAHANERLVEASALLHDIGRAVTHGITHAVEGYKIGIKLGLPEDVLRVIERHIAGGIPQEDATKLGLPEKNYVPETIEEKIVAHADNLIRTVERQCVADAIRELQLQNLHDAAERVKKLHSELTKICGIDLDLLVVAKNDNVSST